MKSPLNMLVQFIFPFLMIYFAYTSIGPVAGLAIFFVYMGFTIYSNRSTIYVTRANKKYSNGNFNGALKDLEASVAAKPNSASVRGSYAYLLIKLGHTEKADVEIDLALKVATLPQDRNSLRLTKALVLWKQNKIEEAVSELDDLLKTFETTNVYATLGFLYIAKGDLNEALEFNLKAKDYNSNNAIILDNLGTSYILLGDYEKALEIYQEVMKLKPIFPEAYYNYARVLEKTGNLEKALHMVRTSLSLRFWNISTVEKEEVEAFLNKLEEIEKSSENLKKEDSSSSDNKIENISEDTAHNLSEN